MKELRQWVCWRSEARERDGKLTKIPYSPRSNSRARSDDPGTWDTFDRARKAVRENGYDGVGFVFTADDPFCGVDLDGCVNSETGEIEPWAMEIVEDLDSYAEISPSGTGLHVIVRATLPEGRRRNSQVEMYDQGRFFTVTGDHLPGAPRSIENRQKRIEALHNRLFPKEIPPKNVNTPSNGPTDTEILRRAESATNGDKFVALWSGDRSGYVSSSEADLALCSMLAFWTGPDKERIAALFSRSGLEGVMDLYREYRLPDVGRDKRRRRSVDQPK